MVECKKAMATTAARGATSGKQGRILSLCHLLLETKTDGEANGQPWWLSGVARQRDFAREEPPPKVRATTAASCVISNSMTITKKTGHGYGNGGNGITDTNYTSTTSDIRNNHNNNATISVTP